MPLLFALQDTLPRSYPVADILLMEDTDALRRVISFALREDGHDVVDSGDGVICYNQDAVLKAQLMITDIDMPNVNGIEAILNAQKIHPNLKIIAMSGAGMDDIDDYLNACADLGVESILQKPFEPDDLVKIVRTLLPAEGAKSE